MTLKHRVVFWTLFVVVLVSSCLLVSRAFGESYSDLSHQYNLVFEDMLRSKIETLQRGSLVQIDLKNETTITGKFVGFSRYDDSVWILPSGKHGIFSNEAYDISELFDINPMKKGK